MLTYECKQCGETITFNEKDFDCGGSFHPDGEELLWGHIKLDHEDVYMEAQNMETPCMIEECYKQLG